MPSWIIWIIGFLALLGFLFGVSANYEVWDRVNGVAVYSGDVSVGMLQQSNTWHAYGGFQSINVTLDLTQNVWQNITNSTGVWVVLENDDVSLIDDCLVFANTAHYVGGLSLSASGFPNTNYFVRVFEVNTSSQVGYYVGATGTGTGNYFDIDLPIFVEAVKGFEYCLQVVNVDNSNDFILKNAIFEVHYLHT